MLTQYVVIKNFTIVEDYLVLHLKLEPEVLSYFENKYYWLLSSNTLSNNIIVFDGHVHTYNSFDSILTPKLLIKGTIQNFNRIKKILNQLKSQNMKQTKFRLLIGLVDHDTLPDLRSFQELYIRLKSLYYANLDIELIYGVEKSTKYGEIIIYFPKLYFQSRYTNVKINSIIHFITRTNSLIEILSSARKLSLYISLPHPFKRGVAPQILAKYVDFIEIFNGRTTLINNLQTISLLYRVGNVIPICGSDAHTKREILRAFTVIYNNDFFLFYKLSCILPLYEILSQFIALIKTRELCRVRNIEVRIVKLFRSLLKRCQGTI